MYRNYVISRLDSFQLKVLNGVNQMAEGVEGEAAGILTDNEKLENEGKEDQLAGDAKSAIQGVADKAEEVIDNVKAAVQKD